MTALPPPSFVASWRPWIWVAVICALFLLARLPVILHEPGGMDENWFAIPGWTVANEGLPRVPYAPERNLASVFWKADVILLEMPPALYYVQAPLFWLFPAGFPTARLASCIAALVSIGLVFSLGRRLLNDDRAALLGCGLYSLSRLCYFPAMIARPDMLCAMFGLLALLLVLDWQQRGKSWLLIAAGVSLGLAGLTHPVAIVYAVQLAVWVCWQGTWRTRLSALAALGGFALLTFSAWLPMILAYPEIFRHQFGSILLMSKPAAEVGNTFWPIVESQTRLTWEHFGPVQFLLLTCGFLWTGVAAFFSNSKQTRQLFWLTGLAVLLLIAFEGRHVTKGYWCYPGALLFLCVARMLTDFATLAERRRVWGGFAAVTSLAVLAMIPGSGFRATATYLQHWGDPAFHGRTFIRDVLKTLPEDGTFVVDPAYVFDVEMSGRKTLLGSNVPMYFQVTPFPYDYLIASRYALENQLPQQLNAVPVARYGDRDNPFACYVEIFQVTKPASHVE